MAAPKGNRFWEARSSHGRKPKFESPELLWEACIEYFDWVEQNPLHTAELVKHQGEATVATLPKMRAMTINGLCIFLDITRPTWDQYRKKSDDFLNIVTCAESIIYEQKLSGAAADLLNPNIIARELGLSDKKEVSLDGPLAERFARAEERLKDAGS